MNWDEERLKLSKRVSSVHPGWAMELGVPLSCFVNIRFWLRFQPVGSRPRLCENS